MATWDDSAYGEGFADVYDDWYSDVSDVAATVAKIAGLAGSGPVLELGVGTGRLAVPLVEAGVEVHGIDVSPAMVDRLRTKPGGEAVRITMGDMVDDAPAGPFTVILAAYNTLFNLPSMPRQQACFTAAANRLTNDGCFVVEGAVFDENAPGGGTVAVRTVEVGRVVLSVTQYDRQSRVASGQFVELSADGVRMRPWRICWATPPELDEMAKRAGLKLVERTSDWRGDAFGEGSTTHISLYRATQR